MDVHLEPLDFLQHFLRFIVSEVKMPCSCSHKDKAFQSLAVRKQSNCPNFGNTSTSSWTPTKQASFVPIYTLCLQYLVIYLHFPQLAQRG